ncbi:hypothetical protein FRACYDRAFT_250239 [Fragilariopsis cylindrus CCMP1102]|uniref:Uncharacterized protein n=1 Tax=Fragilariopsis cylindrus CCMP1102 TaxID=635003 RepID=A0A1E7EPZ3_9STRA|nr:hypothetical protein FRACYDRAFT_250239 [Fragilariopsis cylindrus CCMP1102]|eukprot:OEU08019.1 hypothetical protein FRACYDRAFT_250239 [Fragilariopsis cylindrus CCMP1102]
MASSSSSSSKEASMGVDWFVNQNSILWERIRGYERKINVLNQTKKDLQQQYCIDEKKLDNQKKDNYELEQQYNTLAKDSRNKSEQSKNLSQLFLLLQDTHTRLKQTSSRIQMFIRSIPLENQEQQIQGNVLVVQSKLSPNSKQQEEYQQPISLLHLREPPGTMNNCQNKWVEKITSQQKLNMKKGNGKMKDHIAISSPMLVPPPASATQNAITDSQQQLQLNTAQLITNQNLKRKHSSIMSVEGWAKVVFESDVPTSST